MKLLKPAFVHNQDRPIFSIDIHPKEPKFATVTKPKQYLDNIKKFPGINLTIIPLRAVKEMIPDGLQFGIWNRYSQKKLRWIQKFLKFWPQCEKFGIWMFSDVVNQYCCFVFLGTII